MKTLPIWVLILCMMFLSLSACTEDSATSSADNLSAGTVLFQDDFSSTNSGWGEWNRDGGLVSYDNGALRILVNEPQFDYWSVTGRQFSDVSIEVDALSVGNMFDNDFGIICRYQDQSNFYMLVISSDGYYGIAKMKDGQYHMLSSDQLQYSNDIAQGNSTNHLRGDCIGQNLTLSANGKQLVEVSDADFLSGDVGLLAGAYEQAGVEVRFDNFTVKKP